MDALLCKSALEPEQYALVAYARGASAVPAVGQSGLSPKSVVSAQYAELSVLEAFQGLPFYLHVYTVYTRLLVDPDAQGM